MNDGVDYLSSILAPLDPKLALNDHSEGVPSDLIYGAGSPTDAESDNSKRQDAVSTKSEGENPSPLPLISLDSSVPPPKRYAHHGKRRRSYTEEMFRCQYVDKISRSDLVCNALLWKNRPETLRSHLLEHLKVDHVKAMTDDEVTKSYSEARRIFLQGIPEDLDEDEEESDENGE